MPTGPLPAPRKIALADIPVVVAGEASPAKARSVAPPVRRAAEPYRAYKPQPFTRAERDKVTVLFGGLHWRAERLLQGAMANLGYRSHVLPTATREDLLTGREVADIGQCCPTSFTTGNLVNYLRSEAQRIGAEEVSKNYVYLTAGSCGACRFGQYHQSYELALRNSGLDAFRMFLLGQEGLDQGSAPGGGLDLNLPFTLGATWAVVLSDVVQDLEYQIRPYETKSGETARAAKDGVEILYQALLKRPQRGQKWGAIAWHLATPYFVNAMKEVRRRFDEVEVDRLRIKPKVKITGEFYLQTELQHSPLAGSGGRGSLPGVGRHLVRLSDAHGGPGIRGSHRHRPWRLSEVESDPWGAGPTALDLWSHAARARQRSARAAAPV
jgi:hypothetical protein